MTHKLHHAGIIVNNLEKAIKLYSDILGLTSSDQGIIRSPKDGIQHTMLPIGNNFIELIEPIEASDNSESRFARHLKDKGEGLFDLSIFTDNYDNDMKTLKKKGFSVEEWRVTDLFPGYTLRLAWVPPKYTRGVWIEYVDETSLPKS
jgi:catechol 2,3-dioxygenase-like lactoylglutathione lyase family enzyme